jgi:hypothetical protein
MVKLVILIKVKGVKIHERNWLLLCTLKESHFHFKISYPGIVVSFAKLKQLRGLSPRENYTDFRMLA